MVQWLGLQASTARDMGSILVGELRPHKLCGSARKKKKKNQRMVKMVKKKKKIFLKDS